MLLAFPVGGLTLISLWAGGFTWARVIALSLMVSITAACIVKGSKRTRVELQPKSRQIVVNGNARELSEGASLELGSTDTLLPDSARLRYEVRMRDGSTLRQLLLRSSLPNVLNDLMRLRGALPIRVSVARGSDSTLEQLIGERPQSEIAWASVCRQFSSPLREGQFRIAVIFYAVALVAAFVVVFLVTGQIERGGPIGTLGIALASSLVFAPALIALHMNLGKIRVRLDEGSLRVERTNGLRGIAAESFEAKALGGTWLLRNSDGSGAEVLFLHDGSFFSIPVVGSAMEPWRAIFGQSGAPAQTLLQ